MQKITKLFILICVFSLSLVGCGKTESKNLIKVSTQTPLSGSNATQGEAIKLGAQMALEEKKNYFAKKGFILELSPMDDQAEPKKGSANAQMIGADQDVLGVVGHLNSGVSIPSSQTYEKNNIAMVSPVSTANALTDRKLKSVNRICARDDFQGPAAAEYAIQDLKAKRIFIIQDKTAYGQGLANDFKKATIKLGGNIVGYEGLTIGEKDFSGILNQVKSKNADLIFFGGVYTEGGLLLNQTREKGLLFPFLGADGIDSYTLLEIAGKNIRNTFYSTVANDLTSTAEGSKWAKKYKSAYNKIPEAYSYLGYDAMGVILTGIDNAIKSNDGKKPNRKQVQEAVRQIKDYKGISTDINFDDKGDNISAKIFLFKFEKETYPGKLIGVKTNIKSK